MRFFVVSSSKPLSILSTSLLEPGAVLRHVHWPQQDIIKGCSVSGSAFHIRDSTLSHTRIFCSVLILFWVFEHELGFDSVCHICITEHRLLSWTTGKWLASPGVITQDYWSTSFLILPLRESISSLSCVVWGQYLENNLVWVVTVFNVMPCVPLKAQW